MILSAAVLSGNQAPVYESDVFWAAVGAVVAVVGVIVTVWLTYVPRQKLFYFVSTLTPLLAAPEGVRGDLQLRYQGTLLAEPHVMEIVLFNGGRKDIPSSAFDQGRPILFDVGAPIVSVLQTGVSPESAIAPGVVTDDQVLALGPELLVKKQTTTISLLVDGDEPSLTCTQPVLVNVTVQPGRPGGQWAAFHHPAVYVATGSTLAAGYASGLASDGRIGWPSLAGTLTAAIAASATAWALVTLRERARAYG